MTSVATYRPTRNASTPTNMTGVQFVRLEQLPNALRSDEPIQFPESLSDRVWYDRDSRRLAFRGFMSKATYDRLHSLSNDHAYQRAIEELFRISVFEEPRPVSRSMQKFISIALVTVALLALTLVIPIRAFIMR